MITTSTIARGLLLPLCLAASSCSTIREARTAGDPKNARSYGYHPIDPLPVIVKYKDAAPDSRLTNNARIMRSLPDETMRLAIGEVDVNAGVSYGPAKIGYQNSSYVIVLDYIKFDTKPFSMDTKTTADGGEVIVKQINAANLREGARSSTAQKALVPVYVGVGLRLTASIKVNKGKVDLGNLFALGAAAEAKRITGTLVIQTLGVSGNDISALIPMPSEISTSSIQNAILSLASIKAKMYDEKVSLSPRVVGIYNTIGDGEQGVNRFITAFLKEENFSHPVE